LVSFFSDHFIKQIVLRMGKGLLHFIQLQGRYIDHGIGSWVPQFVIEHFTEQIFLGMRKWLEHFADGTRLEIQK